MYVQVRLLLNLLLSQFRNSDPELTKSSLLSCSCSVGGAATCPEMRGSDASRGKASELLLDVL